MNDDQFLLANAYHDGELTAAERALAESDPAVMAGVDELRALAGRLRDVGTPAAAAVKETAIDAAMTEFHRIDSVAPGSHVVAAATDAGPARHRPVMARWLAVAAAVVGVGLVGAVITQGMGGDDVDDAASMEAPAETASADARVGRSESATADEQPTLALATVPDPAGNAETAPAAPSADVMAADDAAAAGAMAERPTLVVGQTITTPDELGSYGTGLLEQRARGELPPTPETACAQPGILSTTDYLLDGEPTSVLVAVDEQRRTVSAIDPTSCALLVEGPLF